MRNDHRGSLYLLTGVILGIVLGLAYAWLVDPVTYVDTAPDTLRQDFKEQYCALVAAAFLSNNDLARARARLDLLHDPNIAQALTILAQRALAEGRPEAESHALGLLAVALSQGSIPASTFIPLTQPVVQTTTVAAIMATPTPLLAEATQTPTPPTPLVQTPVSTLRTPGPTNTPLSTRTPTATPGAPFVLLEINHVCNSALLQPLIQVQASDAAGVPVPGLEIIVEWGGTQEQFFTGLKPELGLGYADFAMTPGVNYLLRLADGGEPVLNLSAAECETKDGERYWGSWLLVFVQP
jgi:hypothetical protein